MSRLKPHALPAACLLLSAMLLSAALLAPAAASVRHPAPQPSRPLVELTLIDRDSGSGLPAYPHRGMQWVAGEPGRPYTVRLTNTSGERVLVVLSVDGVNAVTGETADPAQSGYVLSPWQSTEITGWRKSHAEVARFVFTELPDSYAARTGRPDNVGSIGIAVFRERRQAPRPPRPSPPIARESAPSPASAGTARRDAAAAESAMSAADLPRQQQRIGTGHGAREWSPVSDTRFVRASARPAQLTELRYDAPHVLASMGIGPPPTAWQPRTPRAFPGGFVADPPRGD
ncbi:hypothetical protein LDO26_13995 [Luteimonas sp. BDR2-5]|uniref:hypothetical protein n=1 Tax=Proluteimonas luteida TaxID=2878685 RepID=UPI001E50ED70|nr:hypothetical protein [Luteimonas sp. BDR2-5]MCD9029310.1 hypothetical protein [Luteimonas sp. BDR2-5]